MTVPVIWQERKASSKIGPSYQCNNPLTFKAILQGLRIENLAAIGYSYLQKLPLAKALRREDILGSSLFCDFAPLREAILDRR